MRKMMVALGFVWVVAGSALAHGAEWAPEKQKKIKRVRTNTVRDEEKVTKKRWTKKRTKKRDEEKGRRKGVRNRLSRHHGGNGP